MTDRMLAALSVIGLILFTGVVVVFVKEIDLSLIILLCLILAVYDFWTTFRDRANGNQGNGR